MANSEKKDDARVSQEKGLGNTELSRDTLSVNTKRRSQPRTQVKKRSGTDRDFALVSLMDLLPLQLLSSGYQPALRCPLLIRQNRRLQNFKRLEPVLLSEGIAVLQHQLHHVRISAQSVERSLRIDTLQSTLLQHVSQVNFVGDDHSHRLLGIGMPVDTHVRDKVTGLVDGLKALKGDILAARKFHQVLDAAKCVR